jgi:hypothetical protein
MQDVFNLLFSEVINIIKTLDVRQGQATPQRMNSLQEQRLFLGNSAIRLVTTQAIAIVNI